MKKPLILILLPLFILSIAVSCSADDNDQTQELINDNSTDNGGGNTDDNDNSDDGNVSSTVFERLVGNTFRQIEEPGDCATCQDEINYYIFSNDGIQVTGTTPDGVCEQNDFEQLGTCEDCLVITQDTEEQLTICGDSNGDGSNDICQTITFLSEIEIQFNFYPKENPESNIIWTAQLFEDEAPCTDWDPIDNGENSVFSRLQGNTYRQIESVNDCGTCEDEINYYIFSEEGLRITGTTLDGTCEQNDFQPIGDCDGCAEIEINTEDLFTVCVGTFPFRLCQTITFVSESEIQFDFPAFNQTWTAQLFTESPPCTDSFFPVYDGVFDGSVYDADNGTFEFPSTAQSWAGFSNTAEIYPLSFPNGGKVTFTGATEGTDIDVYFRFEANPHPNTEPSYNSANVTVTGTEAAEYTVEIPSQGGNTFNSALFYLVTQDQVLTASNFCLLYTSPSPRD